MTKPRNNPCLDRVAAVGLTLCLALSLLFFVGCAPRHPLSIPDDDWQLMSVEQRLQAREKQAELDREVAEKRAAEARAREVEAARELAELEKLRREARYGDRLQCVLSNPEGYFNRRWREVEPVALDLVRGREISFELHQITSSTVRYRSTGYALFDGQTLSLCRDSLERTSSSRNCLRLLGTFEDYRQGIKQYVKGNDFLRGNLRCVLHPGHNMPPRLIIEK